MIQVSADIRLVAGVSAFLLFLLTAKLSNLARPHCIRRADRIYARSRKSDWERAMAKKTRDFDEMPSF